MKKFTFSDQAEPRDRTPKLYFITPGGVVGFTGRSIPGVCRVDGSNYSKAGKWSSSKYEITCPDNIVPVRIIRPWEGWGSTWRSIVDETTPVIDGDEITFEEKVKVARKCAEDNEDYRRLREAIAEADYNDSVELDDQQPLIVTRHAGLVEWLRLHGVTGEVIPHATEENVRGRVVYGVLPLNLAAAAARVYAIDLPGLKPEQRGKDLTPDEMDDAGATLRGYRVIAE